MDGKSRQFEQAALIVDSDDTLRRLLLPVLRAHLNAGEPVLMVVGRHTEAVIRDALGERADRLGWGNPAGLYQRSGSGYDGFRRYLGEQHEAGRQVHVIAEPGVGADPDTPVDRVAAYLAYESVYNEAHAVYGCPVTCLWDARRHPDLVIEDVRSLPRYELSGSVDGEMPAPPAAVGLSVELLDTGNLGQVRSAIREWSLSEGFPARACGEMVVAVSEIATNGLVHGAPPVHVRAWRDGNSLVVQVDDRGGRPISPTAGHHRPADASGGGLGLWLARQLAGPVTTHTAPGCTSVRMYFPYPDPHRRSDG